MSDDSTIWKRIDELSATTRDHQMEIAVLQNEVGHISVAVDQIRADQSANHAEVKTLLQLQAKAEGGTDLARWALPIVLTILIAIVGYVSQ